MKPFRLIVAAICLVVCAPAAAQYPNRPLRLVVPFPPGGAAEIACRSVAQALSLSLGQPVVVETKPGADGHRLLREITIALKRPEVQEQMQRVGFAARGSPPQELATFVREQLELLRRAVRDGKLQPQE